jgi:hypothetical protein
MSAAELRKAAEKLRRQAQEATEGEWFAVAGSIHTGTAAPHQVIAPCTTYCDDADYIATMHPRVGLALADWLDAEASEVEQQHRQMRASFGPRAESFFIDPRPQALTLARLINREGE